MNVTLRKKHEVQFCVDADVTANTDGCIGWTEACTWLYSVTTRVINLVRDVAYVSRQNLTSVVYRHRKFGDAKSPAVLMQRMFNGFCDQRYENLYSALLVVVKKQTNKTKKLFALYCFYVIPCAPVTSVTVVFHTLVIKTLLEGNFPYRSFKLLPLALKSLKCALCKPWKNRESAEPTSAVKPCQLSTCESLSWFTFSDLAFIASSLE